MTMMENKETMQSGMDSSSSTFESPRSYSKSSCISSQKAPAIGNLSKTSSESSVTNSKTKRGGWKAVAFILGNETFERLAVFGLLANFMVYLTRQLHLDQVYAANIVSIWFGVSNFAPLFGAFVSDAYIGRFRTIAFASFATLSGLIVVTSTSFFPQLHPPPCTPQQLASGDCVKANYYQMGVLFLGLCFLIIGSGGVRPCSIPFGVDQFDTTTYEGKKGINSYFNLYYTTFTVVLLFTQTVVVYIQESVSWKIGFGIPTFCMFCSVITFFVGKRFYVCVIPEGSIFSGIAQVLVAAYRKRKHNLPTREEEKTDGVYYDPLLTGTIVASKLPLTKQFRALNKAAFIMEGDLDRNGRRVSKWRVASIQQVEEVKCLARIIPIWLAGILSLLPLSLQGTFFVSQALKMNRHIGPKFQFPAGSQTVITLTTVALWLPLYDRILVPKLRKITKHEGGIAIFLRIGIGMVFSILSMLVAGYVEKVRRDSANSNPTQLGIAPISVFWLAPQLILLGFFEAFAAIGQIEFFNKEFPEHMRSIGNSFFWCSFSVSNYVNSFLVNMVHHATRTKNHLDWLTDNINDGRIDYFYYLIGGLATLNLVYFIYVARKYQYNENVNLQDETRELQLGSDKV